MTRQLFVPGRIELFGKHVDYGGGISMTCAIEEGITADVDAIDVAVIDLEDRRTGRRARVPLRRDARPGGAHGGTYIAAVARRLSRDFGPLRRGVRVVSESTLPRSAGLSSSSAFVTMLTLAVADANQLSERPEWQQHLGDSLALAEYCGAVETGGAFGPWSGERGVGTRGGAQDHVAILCNTESRVGVYGYLPARAVGDAAFPSQWALLVATSGVRATKTGAAQADYNRAADLVHGLLARWNAAQRRDDASLAAALASGPGAREALDLLANASSEAPVLAARLTQFQRETDVVVPGALAAFRSADALALRRWAVESQQGAETALRNQVPETMFLARAALAAGAHASSAFGAGFGGAVWAICDAADAEAVRERWRRLYVSSYPLRASKSEWLRLQPSEGVRWLT
ncbi:MAG: galactokinase [Gemmatimonas sp.]|nr:galactokinase [Gemmatimonas sp.]